MSEFYSEDQDPSIESTEERERRLYGAPISAPESEREVPYLTFFDFLKKLFLGKY